MQKMLAFILLILVAVAVFVPCCATDNCEADQTTSQNNPVKQEGTCSPFVSCSSCAGFAVIGKIVQITCMSVPVLKHQEHQKFLAPYSFTRTVLQPPRSLV